jgi:hypothetical protein
MATQLALPVVVVAAGGMIAVAVVSMRLLR